MSLIAVILFLLLGIVFAIVLPTIKKIRELKQDIASIENDMEARYQNAHKLRRTLSELTNIKDEADNYKKAVINHGQELSIVTELESLASQFNLDQTLNVSLVVPEKKQTTRLTEEGEIQIIKNDSVQKTASEYYEFSFLINGPFNKELDYISSLQKLPYYIIISQIGWEKRENKTDNANSSITLTFKGKIYARPDTQK